MSTVQPPAENPNGASTGPRTPTGKAVSSQNARKHDLCSQTLHLSAEQWVEYNEMRARYGRDLQPAGDMEETLVDEICFNYWRLQQARDAEFSTMLQHPTALSLIALYIRYRTGYERAFYKALDQIQKRQRDRRKQVSSQASEPLAAVRSAEPEAAPDPPRTRTRRGRFVPRNHLLASDCKSKSTITPSKTSFAPNFACLRCLFPTTSGARRKTSFRKIPAAPPSSLVRR